MNQSVRLMSALMKTHPAVQPFMVRVRGGSSEVFVVDKGDSLRAFDLEGGQGAFLYALSTGEGSPLPGADLASKGMLPVLLAANENGSATMRRLAGHDLGAATALVLSGADRMAGEACSLVAPEPLTCVLVVPAEPSSAEQVKPSTECAVEIARAAQDSRDGQGGLPAPPLAEPLLDIRVKAATATTYGVKAGQYIEIMDIDGRQCSDFWLSTPRSSTPASSAGSTRRRRARSPPGLSWAGAVLEVL